MTAPRNPKKIGPADADFVLDDYALYNLNRTAATYNEAMSAALKDYALDTTKWRVLMLLKDKSPSSVSELARRSVTKMPTLTRMLIRMEEEGLVVRRALKDDRRVVQVTMTPKAAKALRTVESIGQKVFERAFEGVDGAELAALTEIMKRVRANLARAPYGALEGELSVAQHTG